MTLNKTDATPMLRQYYSIKNNYKDSLLFFRVGDFYEMFYEDAKIASRELDIILTKKAAGKGATVPLAGVPFHAVDNYLAKLVKKGYKVAICDQLEDPSKAKGIVKRDVIKVLTPGTVTLDSQLNEKENNFIACLSTVEKYSLVYCDITTGEVCASCFDGEFKVKDEILRIKPSEILIDEKLESVSQNWIKFFKENKIYYTLIENYKFDKEYAANTIKNYFNIFTPESKIEKDFFISPAGVLLDYIESTQKMPAGNLRDINFYDNSDAMFIDETTLKNLEIFRNITGDKRFGNLISVIDETVTGGGGRLLKKYLLFPLKKTERIKERLDYVSAFFENNNLRSDLRAVLGQTADIERIISKLSLKSAGPRDLKQLEITLKLIPEIKTLLNSFNPVKLKKFNDNLQRLEILENKLQQTLVDEPPVSAKDGGLIKEGVSAQIDELRRILTLGKDWIAALQKKEREATGIGSLKIGYNRVFGYYIEVTKTNLNSVPGHYIRKQTLTNCERFITDDLKKWEEKILGADEKIKGIEYDIFSELCCFALSFKDKLYSTASVFSEIDVLSNFSRIAAKNNYVKPEITDEDGSIEIIKSRHPVIEKLSGEPFIENDVLLDGGENNILIITGPNMAGKSTYIRQTALVVYMAQIGSFVPASYAKIKPADRIFTRVGASDNIMKGQSTFMVEMIESAIILNNATADSLIILDEIGRGTSTYDGLSIAWAVAEYIANFIKAKTLFATHYHELTELEKILPNVKNYNVIVKEWQDEIIFLRKLVEGGADRSYGIQVARLAGLPENVIKRAKEILLLLETSGDYRDSKIAKKKEQQPTLFDAEPLLTEKLLTVNPDNLTPKEAHDILYELKKMLKEK